MTKHSEETIFGGVRPMSFAESVPQLVASLIERIGEELRLRGRLLRNSGVSFRDRRNALAFECRRENRKEQANVDASIYLVIVSQKDNREPSSAAKPVTCFIVPEVGKGSSPS